MTDADATTDPPANNHRREPNGKSAGQGIGEWIGILIAALIAAFLIRTFIVQTFWIPSASMEQTLLIGDRLLVNKVAYKVGEIQRGDVLVFDRPPGETNVQIEQLIKRVVGLPGDTVEAKDGTVHVNGKPLPEPYLEPGVTTRDFGPVVVPEDHYFVMGDNRSNSTDSRVFGPISEDLVVGKASVRIWPASRIDTL